MTPDSTRQISINRQDAGSVSGMAITALVPQADESNNASSTSTSECAIVTTRPNASSPRTETPGWKDLIYESQRRSGLSNACIDTMICSLRYSTQKQYTVYVNKFLLYCEFKTLSDFNPSEIGVIQFLQSLYESGVSYSVINTACSAIKTFLELLDIPIVFTTKLARFKKGCFNKRPSLPKHTATWDPEIVLRYLNQLGQSSS